MSGTDYSAWVRDVHAKVHRFNLVFIQLGASNEPARRSLLASAVGRQTAQSYIDEGACIPCGTLVIDEVETLTVQSRSSQMGKLRESIFADLDVDLRVILLSRAPRVAFPTVVGSSLLDDASLVHAPSMRFDAVAEWPSCSEDGMAAEEVLQKTLFELGPEVCASLDRAIYESQLVDEEALSPFTARELEALDGAGLTSSTKGTRAWNIPWHLGPLKVALDTAVSDTIQAQEQFSNVSDAMWKIERMIRREVRRRSIASWSNNWRMQCLNDDLRNKVLDRATESAYLAATTVKQIRDPLEWLSLGELLQLTENPKIGRLGLEPVHWRQFRNQIMPIRNRLAHMRTLYPDDETNAVKWRKVLETRLPRP